MSIKYRYSLIKDIRWALEYSSKEMDAYGVVHFAPNLFLWLWTMFWFLFARKPQVEWSGICYIRSSGCWGMYHPQFNMSISVCPLGSDNAPYGLKGSIKHEIVHLEHPEWDELPHEEKEANVNKEMARLG